ncbi:hypothetical protein [Buchnera aphidicola]|uniref:hypothetical protein n=1 Tax=Buchnera aphidicola TaxID=9 RepID=UPI0021C77027|nr:hypothetical protein [Buchnera aphidicola]
MKKLIDIIKKIENTLLSLDTILNQEHKYLLDSNATINELKIIIKKKKILSICFQN